MTADAHLRALTIAVVHRDGRTRALVSVEYHNQQPLHFDLCATGAHTVVRGGKA